LIKINAKTRKANNKKHRNLKNKLNKKHIVVFQIQITQSEANNNFVHESLIQILKFITAFGYCRIKYSSGVIRSITLNAAAVRFENLLFQRQGIIRFIVAIPEFRAFHFVAEKVIFFASAYLLLVCVWDLGCY